MRYIFGLIFVASVSFGAEIELKIHGVDTARKGQLCIGLYDNAKSFMVVTKSLQHRMISANHKQLYVRFRDVSKGSYAVAIFHDQNSNNHIDKNMFGIPKEGYGISNNPSTLFEPTFEDAKFFVEEVKHLDMEVKY